MPAGRVFVRATPRHKIMTGTSTRYRTLAKLGRLGGPKVNMFKMSLTLDGVKKTEKIIKAIMKDGQSATYMAVKQSINLLVTETKNILLVGSLRAYDTGNLYNSIQSYVEKMTYEVIYGIVFSDKRYAIYVHEGTFFMASRPFFREALRRKRAMIEQNIAKAFQKDYSRLYY